MALLLDIFGFLSVILRGVVLTAQSLTIGGIVFLALLLDPLTPRLGSDGAAARRRCHALLRWSAVVLAGVELVFVLTEASVLAGTIDISLADALGADFARLGIVAMAASLAAAALTGRPIATGRFSPLPLLGITILVAQVASSHAAAQLDGRTPLLIADFAHMAGAAAWIGGIPYLLLTLQQMRNPTDEARIGRRFSLIAMGAVAILVGAGIVMAFTYIGSLEAFYGTAYGVMVGTKVLLLVGLLFLGAMNYRVVERLRRDPRTPILRLRRFAEVEIGVGLAVLFAAASLSRNSMHSSVAQSARTRRGRKLTSPAKASLHRATPRISPGPNTTTIGPGSSCWRSACWPCSSARVGRPGRGTGRSCSWVWPLFSSCAPIPKCGRSARSDSSPACAIPRWCSTASSCSSPSPSLFSNGASAPADCAGPARRSSFR
jgi:putative copper export protein